MSIARKAAIELRDRFRLTAPVDVESVAEQLGITVLTQELGELDEVMVRGRIIVSDRLSRPRRRWAIAHGIGHFMLHSGDNLLWMRHHTMLGDLWEQQAEQFAYGLLVDDLGNCENLEQAAYQCGVPIDVLRS